MTIHILEGLAEEMIPQLESAGLDFDLVYLDPPFNTGKNWGDYDDRWDLDEWQKWLSTVVESCHRVLKSTGVMWLHLDERYSHLARLIMDEHFGMKNWVATVQWKAKARPTGTKSIANTHNPITVYGKEQGWRRVKGQTPTAKHQGYHKNRDGDPRGPWMKGHTGKKSYLYDLLVKGAAPTTWWDDVGLAETGRREVNMEFSTPKPAALLRRIIEISTPEGGSILDPCAGSGVVGRVALEMNRHATLIESNPVTVEKFLLPMTQGEAA